MISFVGSSNEQDWDGFVKTLPTYSFLNSSARVKYSKEIGQYVIQKYIEKDGEKIGILTGAITKAKVGKILDLKHSPLIKEPFNKDQEVWKEILIGLKKFAKEKSCFLLRVSPLEIQNEELKSVYIKMKAIKSPTHNIDALISQYIDLTKTEEELRHDMSSSTRHNINKLEKDADISVKVVNDDSMFGTFANFHEQTRKIKGFNDKPMKILLKELKIQSDMSMHYLIIGYYKNKPISIWTLTKYGKYGCIYQAGSDTEFREKKIRITYLLAWEAMKLGKELGCEILDLFGGMVPENCTKHPWMGVNNFKISLGGKKVTYMHNMDIPINTFKYYIFYIYSYLRTIKKGYSVNW